MKLAHWMTSLALLTASFDLILSINVGGSVRFCQVMMLGVIVCALAQMMQVRTILWPRGGYAIALWCIAQGVLITQSPSLGVSVALFASLMIYIAGIAAVLQLYGRSDMLRHLMRMYLLSFVFIAGAGAVQFVCPALHLGEPLIAQWIVHGLIPRINGFSYEPSYFATYLVMGWIMLIDLRASGAEITRGRRWFWYLLLVSVILTFSTSKTAWLLMCLEGLARLWPATWRIIYRQIRRLRAGSLLIPLPRPAILIWTSIAVGSIFLFLTGLSQIVPLNTFLSGSGLNGTAAHSLNDRLQGLSSTLRVVQQHFWVGRSLGGVPATIAQNAGYRADTLQQLRVWWGFPVPVEVFAASGFWGFLPFLWFFFAITGGERRMIREHWNDERSKWLRALIRALIFEWLALFADQNVLRSYLWFHIAIVVVVGYSLRYHKVSTFRSELLLTA